MVRRSSPTRFLVVIMILTRMVSHFVSAYVTRSCLLRGKHGSVEHEFFPQSLRDESCPPDSSNKHSHRAFWPPKSTETRTTVWSASPIDNGIKRDGGKLMSQISQLGRTTLVAVIQQKSADPGARHERIMIGGGKRRTCLVKRHAFHLG